MKKTLTFLSLVLLSYSVKSQDFFRPAEAVKNIDKAEALVIYPEKDDLLRLMQTAPKFKKLTTVKISGICDSLKLSQLFKTVNSFPQLKTLIIEQSNIEQIPVRLSKTIEKIELYENDQLDYKDLVEKSANTSVTTLIMDVYDFNGIPSNLNLLKNLSEIKVYDKGSVVFDAHKKYESTDADVKNNPMKISAGGREISFSFSSAEIVPSDEDMDYLKKSAGADAVTKVNTAGENFELKYANILPPVEGLVKPKENFSIAATKTQVIDCENGTKITVPANAFVDSKGKKVTGNVSIGYREFRNQADVLVSGIPMVFDSAGTKKQFESAGMFEISANVNGEEVFLAKGKKFEVQFPLSDNEEGYNFYYYNDEKGNWENKNELVKKPLAGNEKNQEAEIAEQSLKRKLHLSPAIRTYLGLADKKTGYRVDKTKFEDRFDDMTYTYLYHKNCTTKTMTVRNKQTAGFDKLIRVRASGKTKKGEQLFVLENYAAAHPELSFFWHLSFINEGNSKDFTKNFAGKYFNDVRLSGDGENFEITFKSKNGFSKLNAQLVKVNAAGEVLEKNSYVKTAWALYTKKLKARTKIFNRRINLKTNDLNNYEVKTPDEICLAAYESAQRFMLEKEKTMSFGQWKNYCDSLKLNNIFALGNNTGASKMGKTKSVSTVVGFHNFDRQVKIKERVDVAVNFQDKQKKGIRLKSVYAIDTDKNVVYNYPGEKDIPVTLDKKENYRIVGVTPDGKIVWSESNLVKGTDIKSGKEFMLEGEVMEENPKTMEEMNKLLGGL
ncbi:MAG: hypothetical protein IAF38_06795 [Bacteroidia bacterium]|nr:hypothetical protein [Bacteroidia bacterium]